MQTTLYMPPLPTSSRNKHYTSSNDRRRNNVAFAISILACEYFPDQVSAFLDCVHGMNNPAVPSNFQLPYNLA